MTRQGTQSFHGPTLKNTQGLTAPFVVLFASAGCPIQSPPSCQHQRDARLLLLLLDGGRDQALGVLDVDGLDVAVELLLGAVLIVSSSGDADADSVWHALDTLLPHLLVQLGVEADIGGAL